MAVLLVMFCWQPPRLSAATPGPGNRPVAGLQAGCQHPAARLVSSLGPLLGLAAALGAAAPLLAGLSILPGLLPGAAGPGMAGFGVAGTVARMAASVLLVIAAGELLLQRNYGDPGAPRHRPRQPLNPAG